MSFPGTWRFRPIRLLGTGAMGSVYLVEDLQLGTTVALKTLNLSRGVDLYRFKHEFRALADIKHPNLVALQELISEGPLWFFTMEYVPGLPFDRYLQHHAARGVTGQVHAPERVEQLAALPPAVARDRLLRSVKQLCVGVQAIHEAGCIHRDLKPSNVLVTAEGRVVILDFGLVKQRGSQSLSGAGFWGTPQYMAPEQAMEKPPLPAADWYSVGIMIYEALTGHCPFEGALFDVLLRKQTEDATAPAEVNPTADGMLSDLCMDLLRRDPSSRPSGPRVLERLGVGRPTSTLQANTTANFPQRVFGRELEMQSLSRAFGKMRKGELAVLVVRGASGIGKTWLVEAFIDQLLRPGACPAAPLVLRGRCHERETLPFKALDGVVDGVSHRLANLTADEQVYALPDGISYLCDIFPVLRRLRLTEHERYRLPALGDATKLRNKAFTALRDLLARMARTQPMVVFIDDLQWADRDSFALLRALMQQPGAPPLLLVATSRETSEGANPAGDSMLLEFEQQPEVETVTLGPLSVDDTRSLVDALLESDDSPPATKQGIAEATVREAGGNPFFVGEFVQHLRAMLSPGRELAAPNGGNPRLDDMILARVKSLPEASQRLLRIVVAAGDALPQRMLASAALVPWASEEWERSVSALVEGGLVRRRGRLGSDTVECFHDRIRDAVVSSLDESTLRQLHVQLAEAAQHCERDRIDLLSRYWLAADQPDRAKHYVCEAAAEAQSKLAFDRAAQLYQTAVSLETDAQKKAELLRALGDSQASDGRPASAASAYQAAAALSDPMQATQLRQLAAEQLLRGGQIAEGMAELKEVLKGAHLRLPRGPRRTLWSVGWRLLWLRLRGLGFKQRPTLSIRASDQHKLDVLWSGNIGLGVVDTPRAVDFLLRFVLLALRTGDIRRVAQGFAVLGGQVAALQAPHFAWAKKIVAEAEVLARCSSDPAAFGLARMCGAIVRYFSGELDAAATDLIAVEEYFLSHCHGASWELATTRSFACFALRLAGRIRELGERFDRYTADADRTGDRYLAANLRTYQSIVWLIRDDPARARREIDGVLQAWPSDVYQIQHFFHLYARCEQAIYSDCPEQAWQAIARERAKLRRSMMLRVYAMGLEHAWIRGRVALALAETLAPGERWPLLRQAEKHARILANAELQAVAPMGIALHAAATWLGPAAKQKEALVTLERLVAAAETAGTLLMAESGRWWLGELLGGSRGDSMRERSSTWMIGQGVRNPRRLAHLILPGFRLG